MRCQKKIKQKSMRVVREMEATIIFQHRVLLKLSLRCLMWLLQFDVRFLRDELVLILKIKNLQM